MRDLAGIVKDNQEFSYRNQAIESQRVAAELQTKMRAVVHAIDQELANPGCVDWLSLRNDLAPKAS